MANRKGAAPRPVGMRPLAIAICASFAMLTASFATGRPRFEDYPVTEVFHGRPAAPFLATKEVRQFRTELRRQAASGPNFAGHFTLARWGCGAGCVAVAVIDAISGEVWFAPFEFEDAWQNGQVVCDHSSDFEITSELLVVQGELVDGDGRAGKRYFRWHNHKFSLIHFEEGCPR
jgi:hypothetical protein